MLTPEDLEKIEEKVKTKLSFINVYLTSRIIQEVEQVFVNVTNETKQSAFKSAVNKKASVLFDSIRNEMKKQTPKVNKEVKQAFYDAAGKINYENEQFTRKVADSLNLDANIPEMPKESAAVTKASDLNMTPKEQQTLEKAYAATQKEIANLTGTMPLAGQQIYINACNEAYLKVKQGISPNTAIVDAIKELSSQGITTVAYNGKNDSIEVAIARAVRTGTNKASCEISLIRCNELGANFVRVSQHMGARVTMFDDYTNHSWWQGKVYHLDWKTPALEKYDTSDKDRNDIDKKHRYINEVNDALAALSAEFNKYADFVNTCGYGDIQGIAGINCRHSFAPFYPGINIETEKPLNNAENKKRYEETQHQRAIERAIRKLKKEKKALDSASNDSGEMKDAKADVKRRLNAKYSEYADYCRKNNLPRQNWRISIGN